MNTGMQSSTMPIQSMNMPRMKNTNSIARMMTIGATSSPTMAFATNRFPPERLKAPARTVAPNVTHMIVPTERKVCSSPSRIMTVLSSLRTQISASVATTPIAAASA